MTAVMVSGHWSVTAAVCSLRPMMTVYTELAQRRYKTQLHLRSLRIYATK